MKYDKSGCCVDFLKAFCLFGILVVLIVCLCKMNKIRRQMELANERLTEIKFSLGSKYRRVDNVLFYLPNISDDFIQKIIAEGHFFEEGELSIVSKYIPQNAVILDIGANIGNHSLYWASKCRPAKIYSFEPIPETFDILKKNVELNHMTEVIKPINIGLSDVLTTGEISDFSPTNIGATSIRKSKDGSLKLNKLDNINIPEGRVDFVKIDVENHELFVLRGAIETLKKYKPIIFIEMWPKYFEEGDKFLRNLGYEIKEHTSEANFIYVMKEESKTE